MVENTYVQRNQHSEPVIKVTSDLKKKRDNLITMCQ